MPAPLCKLPALPANDQSRSLRNDAPQATLALSIAGSSGLPPPHEFTFFCEPRHDEAQPAASTEQQGAAAAAGGSQAGGAGGALVAGSGAAGTGEGLVSKWRQKERLKTTAVALVMCLNIGGCCCAAVVLCCAEALCGCAVLLGPLGNREGGLSEPVGLAAGVLLWWVLLHAQPASAAASGLPFRCSQRVHSTPTGERCHAVGRSSAHHVPSHQYPPWCAGVDPPDVIKISPCARLECWVDPLSMQAPKALDTIGGACCCWVLGAAVCGDGMQGGLLVAAVGCWWRASCWAWQAGVLDAFRAAPGQVASAACARPLYGCVQLLQARSCRRSPLSGSCFWASRNATLPAAAALA